jgi:hypothetical protein
MIQAEGKMEARRSRRKDLNARAIGLRRRAVRRAGLPLALLALALQALVCFGHHHFDLSAKANTIVTSGAAQAAQILSSRVDRRDKHAPVSPSHEPCLVCQAVHAAGPPVLDVPQAALPFDHRGSAMPQLSSAAIAPALRAAAFESRAPPLG